MSSREPGCFHLVIELLVILAFLMLAYFILKE